MPPIGDGPGEGGDTISILEDLDGATTAEAGFWVV